MIQSAVSVFQSQQKVYSICDASNTGTVSCSCYTVLYCCCNHYVQFYVFCNVYDKHSYISLVNVVNVFHTVHIFPLEKRNVSVQQVRAIFQSIMWGIC